MVDGLKVPEGSIETKTIRHWAEDAFTWAAGKKEFTDLNPIQCAVGFKLVDWEMGGYDTARMIAEHPKIHKVLPCPCQQVTRFRSFVGDPPLTRCCWRQGADSAGEP